MTHETIVPMSRPIRVRPGWLTRLAAAAAAGWALGKALEQNRTLVYNPDRWVVAGGWRLCSLILYSEVRAVLRSPRCRSHWQIPPPPPSQSAAGPYYVHDADKSRLVPSVCGSRWLFAPMDECGRYMTSPDCYVAPLSSCQVRGCAATDGSEPFMEAPA